MSMSTHVIGFKPADEKWHKMKAVWDACEAADLKVPMDVTNFFNDLVPEPWPGVEVGIEHLEAVIEFEDDGKRGFEVDLDKLPKDVKVIRFFNSW